MLEIVKTVGSIASGVVAVIAVLTVVFKPLRKYIADKIRGTADTENTNQHISEISKRLDEIELLVKRSTDEYKDFREQVTESLKTQAEASKALLRADIKDVYYRYKGTKQIPEHEMQAVISAYEIYKTMGGNSFICEVFERISSWEIIPDNEI